MTSDPITCLFLHSSTDKPRVRELVRIALTDPVVPGFEPWLDERDLDADITIDSDINQRIDTARVIVFCVGPHGLGPYQLHRELPRLARRMAQGGAPRLRLIPLLLPEGNKAAMPDCLQSRSIVNWDRSARTMEDLWALLRRRLITPPLGEAETPGETVPPTELSPEAGAALDKLDKTVELCRKLSIIVGPYDSQVGEPFGRPAALTWEYLKLIGWSPTDGHAMPWPSEAATWASIGKSQAEVITALRDRLARVTASPSDLAVALAHLASCFDRLAAQAGSGAGQPRRLYLLSANVDDALEVSLQQAGVTFFRIIPTHNPANASRIELWRPAAEREPVDPLLSQDLPLAKVTFVQLNQLMKCQVAVFVIKLCGTFVDPDSLVISTADFFAHWQEILSMPLEVMTALRQDAVLVVGSGQSSPLGLLLHAALLSKKDSKQPRRYWVASSSPVDRLSRLEDTLLDMPDGNQGFRSTMVVDTIVRASEINFLRRLADGCL